MSHCQLPTMMVAYDSVVILAKFLFVSFKPIQMSENHLHMIWCEKAQMRMFDCFTTLLGPHYVVALSCMSTLFRVAFSEFYISFPYAPHSNTQRIKQNMKQQRINSTHTNY